MDLMWNMWFAVWHVLCQIFSYDISDGTTIRKLEISLKGNEFINIQMSINYPKSA